MPIDCRCVMRACRDCPGSSSFLYCFDPTFFAFIFMIGVHQTHTYLASDTVAWDAAQCYAHDGTVSAPQPHVPPACGVHSRSARGAHHIEGDIILTQSALENSCWAACQNRCEALQVLGEAYETVARVVGGCSPLGGQTCMVPSARIRGAAIQQQQAAVGAHACMGSPALGWRCWTGEAGARLLLAVALVVPGLCPYGRGGRRKCHRWG